MDPQDSTPGRRFQGWDSRDGAQKRLSQGKSPWLLGFEPIGLAGPRDGVFPNLPLEHCCWRYPGAMLIPILQYQLFK